MLSLFVFLEWVWNEIHSQFVKPWETKNLPCDPEKSSETVWHAVKPWDLTGLDLRPWSQNIVMPTNNNNTSNITLNTIILLINFIIKYR